jgi:hypothetical protein
LSSSHSSTTRHGGSASVSKVNSNFVCK